MGDAEQLLRSYRRERERAQKLDTAEARVRELEAECETYLRVLLEHSLLDKARDQLPEQASDTLLDLTDALRNLVEEAQKGTYSGMRAHAIEKALADAEKALGL